MKFSLATRTAPQIARNTRGDVITGLTDLGLLETLKDMMGKDGELDDPWREPTVNSALDAMEVNVAAVELTGWTGPPEDPSRRRATGADADALKRLLARPHSTLGGRDMRRLTVRNNALDGECWLLKRDAGNRPVTDARARPFSMTVHAKREVEPVTEGRRLRGWKIDGFEVPREALIQFKVPDRWNTIRGLDRSDLLYRTASIAWRARTYLDAFFKNGAQTGGFFSTDYEMHPTQVREFLDLFYEEHGGADRFNKVGVLPNGMKFQNPVQNHAHMELLKILEWARDELLMMLRTPKEVLGLLDTATYSNGLTAHSGFWFENLFPLMREIEEGLNDPVYGLSLAFGGMYIGFDLKHVEDVLKRWGEKFTQLNSAITAGVPRNDAVRILEIPTAPVKGGDVALVQGALVPIDMAGTMSTPSTPAPPRGLSDDDVDRIATRVARSFRREGSNPPAPPREGVRARGALRHQVLALRDTYERRMVREIRVVFVALRTAQLERLGVFDDEGRDGDVRTLSAQDVEAHLADTAALKEELVQRMTPLYESALAAAAEQVGDELGRELLIFNAQHPRALALLETKQVQVQGVLDTVRERLRATLLEGAEANEIPAALKQRVRDLMNVEAKRAMDIAQQESAEIVNGGRFETMQAEGVDRHVWSDAGDDKVRDSHRIDGEVREIGKPFSNGLLYPNDPRAPAREVVRCRCVALAVE